MQAVQITGPRHFTVMEIPAPEPDGQNVIIRVSACGICGSDIHYWESGVDMCGAPGLIPGHEFCGTIIDPGSRTDILPNDRVTALPMEACGSCETCARGLPNICMKIMTQPMAGNNSPGAYAQYLKIGPDLVRKLPEAISDEEAALIEPAAVALHAVRQAGIKAGDKVLITGGGPIGLLCAAWARISGAAYIALTEINTYRRVFAQEQGNIDAAFDAADPRLVSAMKQAAKSGFDIALETSGSAGGINTAVSALKRRGTLLLSGISLRPLAVPTMIIVTKEIEQKAAFSYSPEEFDLTMEYIAGKKLSAGKIINRTISLNEVQETFERLSSSISEDVKVIIRIACGNITRRTRK
jgi:2-desacetyl-2-hydroxyethyl bacteriochlorophyllide A dehydrogenase